MSNNLILRTVASPYGDTTLGSVLSQADVDNNFISLKGGIVQSASLNGTTLLLTKIDGSTLTVDLSSISGGGSGGPSITGGTFDTNNGTLYLNNSTGGTVTITGFTTTYTNSTPTTATVGGITQGSTFSNQTMQQMFDKLLYPYQSPAFTSFNFQGVSSPLEMGEDLSTTPKTFNWSTSNSSNVSANTININGYNTTSIVDTANDGSQSASFTGTVTRTAADTPGTRGWNISGVNTSGTTFTGSLSLRWDYRMFVGTSTNTILNGSQIQALTNYNSIKNGFAGTYNLSAGGYKYFCYADGYGTPNSFKDASNNLNIALYDGYTNPDVTNGGSYELVSVTNAYGETTNYRVYRTLNILGGAINVTIT